MRKYGPGFKEILLQRRRSTSSLVAVIYPWDVPADLRERVSTFWSHDDETEQAAPVEDSVRLQWFVRPVFLLHGYMVCLELHAPNT